MATLTHPEVVTGVVVAVPWDTQDDGLHGDEVGVVLTQACGEIGKWKAEMHIKTAIFTTLADFSY